MRHARARSRLTAPSIVGGAVLVLGAACWAGGPRAQTERVPASALRGTFADLVGWYEWDGTESLLTWAASGDLALFGLQDTLFMDRFRALERDAFHWSGVEGDSARRVLFERGPAGTVTGFRWAHSGPGLARRVESPAYLPREVTFASDSVELAGTVFVPPGAGPFPGAVVIHGSGASSRDNAWYMSIVDALARSGVAVLFPDKRGSGRSGGQWEDAGFDDFSGDALAGVAVLRAWPGVDPKAVGVIGISQGGRIAPIVARDSAVAFAVNISGAAVPLAEQLRHEVTQDLRRSAWPGFLQPLVRSIDVALIKRRRPDWWRMHGMRDPIEDWRRVDVPALVVYGRDDELDNVPVRRSAERLRELGLPHLELRIYEGSGHALYAPGTTRIRSDLLELLAAWVHEVGTTASRRPSEAP